MPQPSRANKHCPNAIGEPVLPPTPLSPDFDPLASAEADAALSGFGGSLRSCCPKTAPSFAVSLHPAGPKTNGISRFARLGSPRGALRFARSGRTARKHFFHPGSLHRRNPKASAMSLFAPFGSSRDVPRFAPFRPNHPKAFRPSRFAPAGLSCDVPPFAAVPVEPPESVSPIAGCSARLARKPPWHRVRSTRFDPKVHQGFPGRSSGPGAIIRRVSAVPATGGLRRSDAEASPLRLLLRCPSLLPGRPVR